MSAVELRGIAKAFGPTVVLRDVNLELDGCAAILGASGSGKTTLLRIIAGLEEPDRGTVEVAGAVGYVPQDAVLFPHLTVLGNVRFGLRRRDRRAARVPDLVELVGLRGLERRYPHQLSGGQQQRVALARALAIEPRVVLLDEPFAALDASRRSAVRADVVRIIRAAGTAAVLVTHDQDEALSMADHVAVLRDGVIVQHDTPARLYHEPRDAEVARFVGDANLVPAEVHGGRADTVLGAIPVAGVDDGPALVLVRPEQVALDGELCGDVVGCEFFGHDAMLRVVSAEQVLLVRVTGADAKPPGTRVRLGVRGPCRAFPRAAA